MTRRTGNGSHHILMQKTYRPETAGCLPSDPVVEFFDIRAEDYDREYNDSTPGGYALRVRRRKVMDLFDQPGGRVLDVGCGPGVMAEEIRNRGCSFWGVDPSSKMIEICRRRFAGRDRVHFHAGDALRLDFPESFFDGVLCMGVIDALRDRRLAIREMLRVLKPGGTLILTFTNAHSPYTLWRHYVFYRAVSLWRRLCQKARGVEAKRGQIRAGEQRVLYSPKAACELVRSEGSELLQIMGYYYNICFSPLDEIMPSVALWLTELLEDSTSSKPDWMAAGLIIKARKM